MPRFLNLVMEKNGYVTVCPKCGSNDISFEKEAVYVTTGLMNQFRQCNNCGFHGMMFPEILKSEFKESDVKKIKNVETPQKSSSSEPVKTAEPMQTSFGKGYFKYLAYIAVPLIILFLLLYFL